MTEKSKDNSAVTDLIQLARESRDADKAMKFSQAACNAANALDRISEVEHKQKTGY